MKQDIFSRRELADIWMAIFATLTRLTSEDDKAPKVIKYRKRLKKLMGRFDIDFTAPKKAKKSR